MKRFPRLSFRFSTENLLVTFLWLWERSWLFWFCCQRLQIPHRGNKTSWIFTELNVIVCCTSNTLSPLADHCCRGRWGKFQDKGFFSNVQWKKSLLLFKFAHDNMSVVCSDPFVFVQILAWIVGIAFQTCDTYFHFMLAHFVFIVLFPPLRFTVLWINDEN